MAYPSPENHFRNIERERRDLRQIISSPPAEIIEDIRRDTHTRAHTRARKFDMIFCFIPSRVARQFISLSLPLLRSPVPPTPPFSRALFERVA